MLQPLTGYVFEHRRGLVKTGSIVGGLYLVGRYVADRLQEVRDKVTQERIARDRLKRRFQQTQEDISYTVMALIPTLAQQILEEMDVEGLIQELQTKSRTLRSPAERSPTALSESSLASSVEIVPEHDARSDAGSMSISSFSGSCRDSNMGDSSQSWVDQCSASLEGPSRQEPNPHASRIDSLGSQHGAQLSDSVHSAISLGNEGSGRSSSMASDISSKSKGELWNEVKILTFTRTLTILYSTTLLSLFTNIQLTLLGRSKYIQSILQLEREERLRERSELRFSPTSLLLGGAANMLDYGDEPISDEDDGMNDDIEMKYLTLSWWILHVGWKDVSERVRRGVEEVFDGVSLKLKLGAMDLHRLVSDVRRRVEHEITFEGNERKINFVSTLLPPTVETMQHILIQGGIPASRATNHTPLFMSLLEETRTIVTSSNFERVLEVCLDRAADLLLDGLHKNVFVESGWRVDESGQELRLRLAGLLPGLARWSHLALNGLPNELIDGLMDVREVAGLSAIVFSRFEDRFS